MLHPAYTVRYSVLTTNSALLTIIFNSVSTTLVYNDKEYSVRFVTLTIMFDYLNSPYRAVNTLPLSYTNQSVNAV